MNPNTPDLLSRILKMADATLDRPSGDIRRLDTIEKLFEEADRVCARPSEERFALVNEWTLLLIKMMRKLEQLGPLGPAEDVKRALAVGHAIVPGIIADSLEAHRLAAQARPATSDHDFHRRPAS